MATERVLAAYATASAPFAAALALLTAIEGCSNMDSASRSADSGQVGMGGASAGPDQGSHMGGGINAGVGGSPLPPEKEDEAEYLAPVTTGRFLWTANPLSGRIALIDAVTLSVKLTTAGDGPTQVVGLPELDGHFGALVLNERSDDATLFRLGDDGLPNPLPPFRTHSDANTWAVSPSGRFAVAWTDAKKRTNVDRLETFQDITLFSLDPGNESAVPLTVGARPRAFAFDAGERHGFALTEEGISVIDLGGLPEVTHLLPVSDDPLADVSRRDVDFAADGSYAVVRNQGETKIGVLSLPDGGLQQIELGSPVTDLDLAPDGSRAFAVLGQSSEVVVVSLPLETADAATLPRIRLPGETIGSIALNRDGSAAVIYSTSLLSTRVTLLKVSDSGFSSPRTQDLFAPVAALFASPDPRFAVAFQSPPASSKKPGAFSLLSLEAERVPKLVATPAAPAQIAFAPDGESALVTVRSDSLKSFGAYLIGLVNQQVDFVDLESPPLSAGVIPAASRGYIAQSHPEGRITFISLLTGEAQTITGFELAARIRE